MQPSCRRKTFTFLLIQFSGPTIVAVVKIRFLVMHFFRREATGDGADPEAWPKLTASGAVVCSSSR